MVKCKNMVNCMDSKNECYGLIWDDSENRPKNARYFENEFMIGFVENLWLCLHKNNQTYLLCAIYLTIRLIYMIINSAQLIVNTYNLITLFCK